MWSVFERGALPKPDLRNLDIYHQIGLTLDLENIELLNDDAYRALYAQKLTERDRHYPIEPDGRPWRATR